MYRIKLTKSLSYTGAVSATKARPVVCTEDEAVAKQAIASGYFELIGEPETPEPAALSEDIGFNEALEALNKSQLEAMAAYHDISLAGCKSKGDYMDAIKAAAAGMSKAERLAMLNAGSPTMVELQEK